MVENNLAMVKSVNSKETNTDLDLKATAKEKKFEKNGQLTLAQEISA